MSAQDKRGVVVVVVVGGDMGTMLMDSLELSQQLPTPSHPPSDADQCGGGSTGTLREASKIISNPAKPPADPCKNTFDIVSDGQEPRQPSMKLNVKNIRYVAPEDWRVLTAVCALAVAVVVGGGLTLMEMHTDRTGQP